MWLGSHINNSHKSQGKILETRLPFAHFSHVKRSRDAVGKSVPIYSSGVMSASNRTASGAGGNPKADIMSSCPNAEICRLCISLPITTIVTDDELFTYAERAKGRVVVLTGA
jgi:hypothetical protein